MFPADYPFKAPKAAFVPPLLHPNVDPYGVLDFSLLKTEWSPAYNLYLILFHISTLFDSPQLCFPEDKESNDNKGSGGKGKEELDKGKEESERNEKLENTKSSRLICINEVALDLWESSDMRIIIETSLEANGEPINEYLACIEQNLG